ncbi:Importin-5 [Drechslerella dactyloides]|uniref:Importin-5 n=1 Tax=Drechslerella dactyloides TaxID=74499 RepID=A0AAD6NM43_DREDA|nr:Importin-5 [Drechslerella dactyloides]
MSNLLNLEHTPKEPLFEAISSSKLTLDSNLLHAIGLRKYLHLPLKHRGREEESRGSEGRIRCRLSYDDNDAVPNMSADARLALEPLLHALISTDNAARSRAEEVLANEWVAQRPEMLMLGLADTIRTSDDPNGTGHLGLLSYRAGTVCLQYRELSCRDAFAFPSSGPRSRESYDGALSALLEAPFIVPPTTTTGDPQSHAKLQLHRETRTGHANTPVLFRRMAGKTVKKPEPRDLFISIDQNTQQAVQNLLIQCFGEETNPHVRNKIGDAIADIARQIYDDERAWPELLATLFHASKSADPSHREGAFRIFATTPTIIEKNHADAVRTVFQQGFRDDAVSVRIAAMEAFSAFFHSIRKAQQNSYAPLLPDMLNILVPLKTPDETDKLARAFMALIELAEISPKMFKTVFNVLVNFGIQCIQDKDLGDSTRQNALELLATFADNAPGMCRKDPNYTADMVTQCLSLMTDIGMDDDDATDWNESDDLDIDESDMNHVVGEQCMDRLANKLGGKTVLPPTFNWLPRMMNSASWRDRHAALMAISAISEGCRDLMLSELDKVLELVVPSLKDEHPRVKWAGCNAIGQMSTDFAGVMQEKYHAVVMDNIIPVLSSPEPRVQSHAAAALVNFCEEAEKEVLEPYLDRLLSALLQLLRNPKRYVQEQALSTIATIADSAEQAFARYYDVLMPLLFSALRQEQTKDTRLLRAKAMECATLITLAVGKEKVGKDAVELVQILGNIQQNVTEPDDPQGQYLLHCWGRMCRVMGTDFLPYLPAVMPPLLELASAKADVQLMDGKPFYFDPTTYSSSNFLSDKDEVEQMGQEDGWELVPVRGKYIGIKTSVLDEKHMAIELLVVYAQQLEAAFDPYVPRVLEQIALPGLSFFFHDPVRTASARCIPQLLNAVKKAHGQTSQNMVTIWGPTVNKILDVLATEPAVDTLAEIYSCFYECVDVVGANCLSDQHLAAFANACRTTLEDYLKRVALRGEEMGALEDGEELSEDTLFAIEDDQTLLADMNKAFHNVFKSVTTRFLPYFRPLRDLHASFMGSRDASDRQWALCIVDDCIEFCGPESWQYHESFLKPLMESLQDDNPAIRQAAAYGIGIAAKSGGPVYADFVAAALPALFQVTQLPKARVEDHVYATENACASIAKILHSNSSKVGDIQAIATAWIETLPVVNDEEAAPYAYAFLAELVDQYVTYHEALSDV